MIIKKIWIATSLRSSQLTAQYLFLKKFAELLSLLEEVSQEFLLKNTNICHCEEDESPTWQSMSLIMKHTLIKEYELQDEVLFLQRTIFTTAVLACFFHEYGHISQQHFPDKPCSLNCEITVKDSDTPYVPNFRALQESEADSIMGYCVANECTNRLTINCNESVRNEVEEKIIIMSLFSLFYTLHHDKKEAESNNYPPLLWRIIASTMFALNFQRQIRQGKPHSQNYFFTIDIRDESNLARIKFIQKLCTNANSVTKSNFVLSDKNLQIWYDFYMKKRELMLPQKPDKNILHVKRLLKQDTLSPKEVKSLLDTVQLNMLGLLDADECYNLEKIIVKSNSRQDCTIIGDKEKINQIINLLQSEQQ